MHAMSSRVACALRTSASRTAGISLSSLSRYLCARTTLAQSKHGAHIRFHSSNSGREPSEGGTVVHSFADPDRPDLFYHLFAAPTSISSSTPVFALSFLSEPPPSVVSAAVIGWLPASGEGEQAGLNDFVENERFREALHEAVQSALRDGVDEVQKNGAIQLREGWMHIHDNRNIPALGRIGEPDDIIGSVRVENGEIMAETYQPMPSYRLCTADGVLQLTEGLAQRLVEVLQAKVREEQQ
ncbi:hypothetical protein BN946_scf184857.g43 [Trametes cinnabarina]|uniref:Uncharacterized protein n=1 Tax=Pycnoporus cinnabarinus TaxID=5643 RepID=A0A060STH7_PYCCI|nr:hypothetical protein BN946_scf184857.g43 [Trametes cinnabarina]